MISDSTPLVGRCDESTNDIDEDGINNDDIDEDDINDSNILYIYKMLMYKYKYNTLLNSLMFEDNNLYHFMKLCSTINEISEEYHD